MTARLPFAVTATALAMAVLGAPWMTANYPLAALAVRSFFSPVCHQNPGRSFFFDGAPVAVCVRCLGVYCGMAMGAWFSLALGARLCIRTAIARRLFFTALSFNIFDVATEALHLHGNLPVPRLLLGAALGFAVGVLLDWGRESASSFQPLAAISHGADFGVNALDV